MPIYFVLPRVKSNLLEFLEINSRMVFAITLSAQRRISCVRSFRCSLLCHAIFVNSRSLIKCNKVCSRRFTLISQYPRNPLPSIKKVWRFEWMQMELDSMVHTWVSFKFIWDRNKIQKLINYILVVL